jgi:single-strand DNA-binding protein
MSQGGYVTLVGFVAQDPNIRTTATGKLVTKVRVGTTPRCRDGATGQWRDAETSYYNVSCWSRLADHVRASLHKGDPVIVKGRFRPEPSRTRTVS